MCDFDITSFRDKATSSTKKSDSGKEQQESSYALYLKKRKTLGLDDSDSESDDDVVEKHEPLKKRLEREHKPNKTPTTTTSQSTSTPPAPAPASRPEETYSPLDTELALLAREKAKLKEDGSLHEILMDLHPRNVNPEPISLLDDDEPRNDGKYAMKTPRPQRKTQVISLDIDDLDPELACLSSQDLGSSMSDTQRQEVVPEKVQIKVSYVSLMETTDPSIRTLIDQLSKPVKFIMLKNNPFDILMEQYCRKKMLSKTEMVLVYDNLPVVLRATPSSLSMSTTSTNRMEVYKRTDFDKKLERDKEIRAARLAQYNESTAADDDDDNSQEHEEEEKEEEPQEDCLHIKLRGKDNKDIGLRVKPTTRINSIIKEYIKLMELGITADKIQLSFEGETLEPSMTMADTELEDQDMVSVIIHS